MNILAIFRSKLLERWQVYERALLYASQQHPQMEPFAVFFRCKLSSINVVQ